MTFDKSAQRHPHISIEVGQEHVAWLREYT